MRFSTTAIIASVAAGHAAAGPTHHHRHAALHAAREAAAEPGWQDVDYSNTALYKDVNWSSVFGQGGASSTVAPAPAATQSTPAQGSAKPVVNNVVQASNVQPAGNTQSSQTHSSSTPKQSSGGSSNSVSDLVSNGVGSLLSQTFSNAAGLTVKTPSNSGFSLGQGTYTINAKNNKSGDMHLICWVFTPGNYDASMVGMGAQAPGCNVKVPAGKTQAVTIPSGASGACAPAWDDTKPAPGVGYVWNTWLEWTMTPGGVVDVSYEPNMGGDSIVATVQESGCSSSKESCGFICNKIETPATNSCMNLGFYTITDCKGQPGANNDQAKQNGGCGWPGHSSATIDAVFG